MFVVFECLGLIDLVWARLLYLVAFMCLFTIRVYYLFYVVWLISYPCLLVILSHDIVFVIFSVCEYFRFYLVKFCLFGYNVLSACCYSFLFS